MKKIFLTVLMLSMLAVFGCDDSKPNRWETSRRGWEIWGQGKLVSITHGVKDPSCAYDEDECTCDRLIQYTFNNGQEVYLRLIKDPGTIMIGQHGTLWKWNFSNRPDSRSWFQWKINEDIPIDTSITTIVKPIISAKKREFPTIPIDYTERPIWTDASKENPERYTPVLIKFKNETLSVGYINNINEWKLGINRREDDGGNTVSKMDILFWKSLDIE